MGNCSNLVNCLDKNAGGVPDARDTILEEQTQTSAHSSQRSARRSIRHSDRQLMRSRDSGAITNDVTRRSNANSVRSSAKRPS